MSAYKLFTLALAVTVALGASFFVDARPANAVDLDITRCRNGKINKKPARDVTYYKNHKKACDAALASPSPSVTPSVSPTVSPSPTATSSVSPTPSVAPSPTPIVSLKPVGKPLEFWQRGFKKENGSEEVVVIDGRRDIKKTTLGDLAIDTALAEDDGSGDGSKGTGDDGKTGVVPGVTNALAKGGPAVLAAAPYVAGAAALAAIGYGIASLFGGDDDYEVPKWCYSEAEKKGVYEWNEYAVKKNITVGKNGSIQGFPNSTLDENYIISNGLITSPGNTARWDTFKLLINYPKKESVKLYYRVSDVGVTMDPKDAGWVELSNPETALSPCTKQQIKKLATYKVNRVGKYFQFKIHLTKGKQKPAQNAIRAELSVQPLEKTETYPSPSPTPSTTPTASTTHGKITIVTKKLVFEPTVKKVDDKTGSAPLPDITPRNTPSPTPTPSASTKPKVDPLCFADHETDYAPEVPIRIRQTDGGDTLVEDEETNDLGLWKGLEGKVDEFKTGSYRINFGEFQKDDYKLVGICVTPDDYLHYVKTQTTASGSQAIIMVQPNKETKVTVLYAPRDKPYVSLDKFAVTENNKVKRVAYPGQSFRYVIRYENTGDTAAHNLVIRDVVPEQYYVPNEETLDKEGPFTSEIDDQGRTVISKTVGTLAKGQKGSLTIPVVLRSNAFGSPDDIASRFGVDTSGGGANQPTTKSSPTEAATDSGDGALNLE